MSREIKFRAWDKENKKMQEVSSIKFDEKEVGYIYEMQIPEHNIEADECFLDFDEVELMQFTGLKDCKGVKIYEGDIVERSIFDLKKGDYTRKSEVHFLEGSFCIYTEDWFSQPLSDDIAKECKVIGNIYENKELLEERK